MAYRSLVVDVQGSKMGRQPLLSNSFLLDRRVGKTQLSDYCQNRIDVLCERIGAGLDLEYARSIYDVCDCSPTSKMDVSPTLARKNCSIQSEHGIDKRKVTMNVQSSARQR